MSEQAQPGLDSLSELELLRDVVLSHVDLAEGYQPGDFSYDPALHGLVVSGQTEDTLRLAFFRAVPSDGDLDNPMLNRTAENAVAANTQYGVGLYGGNSVEAVAHYAWRDGRTIKLFLTPELQRDQVLDHSTDPSSRRPQVEAIKRFSQAKLDVMRHKDAHTHDQQIGRVYGDSQLVILDKPIDVRLSQRIQSGPFTYPVAPRWYLWRGSENTGFEAVGQATRFPTQRHLAKVVVNKVMGV